jgi:hypothetical protein
MRQPIKRNGGLTGQVEQAIRTEIGRRQPGDRLPTERMLADQLGVSIVKVREALTLLQREGLVERRHGRGTFVGTPPAGRWIAVVMIHDLAHPTLSFYERALYQSVRQRLNDADVSCRGYTAFGDPTRYEPLDCPEFWHDLAANRIRHVVPICGDLPPDLSADLARRGIGETETSPDNDAARAREMIRLGTQYLLAQGRRRLAMMGWVSSQLFEEELRAAGVDCCPDWVRCDLHPNLAGAGWQEFRDIWRSPAGRPDGLLISNDVVARDAAIAISELGVRVPDELLVVTHTNRGSGQWYPFPVAQLEVDPAADAAAMAQAALRALGTPTPATTTKRYPQPACRLIPLGEREPETARTTTDLKLNILPADAATGVGVIEPVTGPTGAG